jgi:hypothetical protein
MSHSIKSMDESGTKHISPHGVVSYTKGAVVQDAGQQYVAKRTILKTYQVVWYILALIEILLGFRVALQFLGANTRNIFTLLVYSLSEPLVAPFFGIFGVTRVVDRSTIEWTTLFAMIVYVFLAWAIVKLLFIIKPVTPTEVEQKVD